MTAFLTPDRTASPAADAQHNRDLAFAMQSAIEHHRQQQFDTAAALYRSVLQIAGDHADAHYHLGVLFMQTGRPAEAVPHFEAALGQVPKNGQIWVYYINALVASEQTEAARMALDLARQHGLPEPAVQTLRARIEGEEDAPVVAAPAPETAAVAVASADDEGAAEAVAESATEEAAPESDEADKRVKLDVRRASAKEIRQFQQLVSSGKLDAALKAGRRLTQQYPAHGDCWIELGRVLQSTGHYGEAVEAAEHAARLLPNHLVAQLVLADRLVVARQYGRAAAHCERVLEKHPENAALHRNLGSSLLELGRIDEGFAELRRAVELAPTNAIEIDALATALGKHGLFDEAEAAYRRALELAPMQASTHSNLLFYLMHKPDFDAASLFAEFREFAARHEAPLLGQRVAHANDRDPARQLRIGFVSGDLINHPVAYFFLSVLEHLARDSSLSLHIYSNYLMTDAFTDRIRRHAQTWTEVFGMNDQAVAQKIRDDRIDILIDLSGHTGRNRMVAFAHKPAPVQASWIGNPSTTGLDSVDYYLSDRFVTPFEAFESRFSEKLVFLPALAPFKPHPDAPAVNELPALKNGHITFGSFSRIVKISKDVVALWARVLREVPDSRMIIGAVAAKDQMIKLTQMFVDEGIDVSRISFLQRAGVTTYLQQHNVIDVCLDTFPFGNSTTTMQALWMGVPTMTLPGDSMASRSSTGWLTLLGLDAAFVAQDKDDFVRKCAALAADPTALAIVRSELREYCRQSVLIDAEAIADSASRAFRIMWQRWCDGLAPEHFEVEAQATQTPASMLAEPAQADMAAAPVVIPEPAPAARSPVTEHAHVAVAQAAIAATTAIAQIDAASATTSTALQPCYEQVVVLCPVVTTGGPEALHQLAQVINANGGNAQMAYYGQGSTLAEDGHFLRAAYAPNAEFEAAYARYAPTPLKEAPLNPGTLIIFPEVQAARARTFPGAKRAVWWLSVDNAIGSIPELADPAYASELLREPGIIHFYQSDYARRFLERHGAREVLPLFDFINRDYLNADLSASAPARRLIGFFPRKGGALATRFVNQHRDLPVAPIQNMSREQVRATLAQCAVYIDFGHHPGKDRVPREAAVSGAVVFLHERGAASCYADHPLDSFYLFREQDIESGLLHAKITTVLARHAEHFAKQRLYRQRVLMEVDEFALQVKTAFFDKQSRT
ncbi:putative Protein O-GlcNAc transferase [Paraburkholderia tropica]|uniref:tetratricopeptide repeat protein n=1 Tax=Paraburkholderia tropica TaxID=92647 RepID=UPI001CAD3F67|nr:tetratricopeptide repeat protein [Paraburkholderia tropica]CAG9194459.1 putative Protein O-GlcNAc transferase [Paraburkholderia tropica]